MIFCKTKSGTIHKVWSDNIEDETMNIYSLDEIFDAESTNTEIIDYADIDVTDRNLAVLENQINTGRW